MLPKVKRPYILKLRFRTSPFADEIFPHYRDRTVAKFMRATPNRSDGFRPRRAGANPARQFISPHASYD